MKQEKNVKRARSNKLIILKTVLLFLSLIGNTLSAQSTIDFKKFPFDTALLQKLSVKKDTIMPKFIDGKFYYVNIITNKKISEQGFLLAYPFNGNNYALMADNISYAIIDRAGNIKKTIEIYAVPYYPGENSMASSSVIGIGGDYGQNGFDLMLGERTGIGEKHFRGPNIFAFVGNNKKYGIKQFEYSAPQNQQIIISPILDSIYFIGFNAIIAKKNGKIGIMHTSISFDYEDVVLERNHFYQHQVGLLRNNMWEYYDLMEKAPKLRLTSKYKCSSLGELVVRNGFGIFRDQRKYNILFNDGETLPIAYDWISANGAIAINNNNVYLLGQDGNPFLYYSTTS